MIQPQCSRCQQTIAADDTIACEGSRIFHLDCRRPRGLSGEERALLFKYCFDHAVAECSACALSFRLQELGSDLLANRTHLCPKCRADLIACVRQHLYGCTMLPENVRARAREARVAAQRLIKQSHQLSDRADVLMREAEAATLALRETMRQAVGN